MSRAATILISIALVACGAATSPSDRERTATAHATATASVTSPLELRVVASPLIDLQTVAADDSGQRFVRGGVRIELGADGPVIAEMLSTSFLFPYRMGESWLFLDADNGRLLRSDAFLGNLVAHGAADATLVPCRGQPDGRRFFLGSDGQLYAATETEPLAPVALPDALVLVCVFTGSIGTVWTTGGSLGSTDGGSTWSAQQRVPVPHAHIALAPRARGVDHSSASPRPQLSEEHEAAVEDLLRARAASGASPRADASERGQADCSQLTSGVFACPAGIFVARTDGEWAHVAAAAQSGASAARSAEGEPVLLGWGCHGEPRMLCVIDPESGSTRTVDRPLDLGVGSVFSGGRVYIGSEDRSVLVVDIESGRSRRLELGNSARSGHLREIAPLPGGVVACVVFEFGDGDTMDVRLMTIAPDGEAVNELPTPPDTVSAWPFDATRALALDLRGRVMRTDDGGRRWTDTGVRSERESFTCADGTCRSDSFTAALFPADAPPSPPLDQPAPAGPVGGYRIATIDRSDHARGLVSGVSFEARNGKLFISATWVAPGGVRRSEGFLRGYADAEEVALAETSDNAALVQFEDLTRGALVTVLARAGGPLTVLARDRGGLRGNTTTTVDGSLVLVSDDDDHAGALHIVRPTGATERRSADAIPPSALRSLSDGTLEAAWHGRALSGAVRVVTERGVARALAVSTTRPCEATDRAVERWWLRQTTLPVHELGLESRAPSVDVGLDIDATGDACIRSIEMDDVTFEAAAGGALIGPESRLVPVE